MEDNEIIIWEKDRTMPMYCKNVIVSGIIIKTYNTSNEKLYVHFVI